MTDDHGAAVAAAVHISTARDRAVFRAPVLLKEQPNNFTTTHKKWHSLTVHSVLQMALTRGMAGCRLQLQFVATRDDSSCLRPHRQR